MACLLMSLGAMQVLFTLQVEMIQNGEKDCQSINLHVVDAWPPTDKEKQSYYKHHFHLCPIWGELRPILDCQPLDGHHCPL